MQNKLLGTILCRYGLHTFVRFDISGHFLYGCLTPLCSLAVFISSWYRNSVKARM